MCEKPSNPSSACSGFVNTELKRVNLPWLFTQMPGWRGVPLFSGNHVDTTPIGRRETPSSGMLVGVVEELHLWHCQESSMFCICSMSFWWLWPRALICCLWTQENVMCQPVWMWHKESRSNSGHTGYKIVNYLKHTYLNVLINMRCYSITKLIYWGD